VCAKASFASGSHANVNSSACVAPGSSTPSDGATVYHPPAGSAPSCTSHASGVPPVLAKTARVTVACAAPDMAWSTTASGAAHWRCPHRVRASRDPTEHIPAPTPAGAVAPGGQYTAFEPHIVGPASPAAQK